MDLAESASRLREFRRRASDYRGRIYPISALTGKGVAELVRACARELREI
jgi:hypothetical protein